MAKDKATQTTRIPAPIRFDDPTPVNRYVTRAPSGADWEYWRCIPGPELWELVALTLDVEPREFRGNPPRILDVLGYRDRLELFALRAGEDFPQYAGKGDVPHDRIPLRAFIDRAIELGITMPERMRQLQPPAPAKGKRHRIVGAVTQPRGAMIGAQPNKHRAILDKWQIAPKLPLQTWRQLADTFANVKDRAGMAIQWEKESSQRTRKTARAPLRLADVECDKRNGKTYEYSPEGVAVWLHYSKGAKLHDVGMPIYELIRKRVNGPDGLDWDSKIDAWRGIKAGDANFET